MGNKYIEKEFGMLIEPIIKIEDFQKMKEISHHGITRFDHSLRVAYYSYKITKLLHLEYHETTKAALLHDFFLDEVDEENNIKKLLHHPEIACQNAKKYFNLSNRQEDIIKTHMFPVTFRPPKYLESWIVDLVDDISSFYERFYSTKQEISAAHTFLLLMMMNILRMR